MWGWRSGWCVGQPASAEGRGEAQRCRGLPGRCLRGSPGWPVTRFPRSPEVRTTHLEGEMARATQAAPETQGRRPKNAASFACSSGSCPHQRQSRSFRYTPVHTPGPQGGQLNTLRGLCPCYKYPQSLGTGFLASWLDPFTNKYISVTSARSLERGAEERNSAF